MRIGKLTDDKGISLIEILVVISIFAVLGIVVTESIILSLQGSKKSEGLVLVRENLNHATGIMERQIRNADSIPSCPDPFGPQKLDFIDQDGAEASFSCLNIGSVDGYVASGSANLRLTSDAVSVTECSLVCSPSETANPPYVDIKLTAQSATLTGAQNSAVSTSTRINLRNY